MTRYKFDVMVKGRFYCTMKYEKKSPFPIDIEELYEYIISKLPTLKRKKIEICFY